MQRLSSILVAIAALGTFGCEPGAPAPAPVAPQAPDPVPSATPAPVPSAAPEPVADAAPEPEPPAVAGPDGAAIATPPPPPAGAPQRISARHILVAWAGATDADPTTRRTRREALAKIRQLADQIAAGEDFATLAQASSDDSSAARGGDLGAFGRGAMVPAFENAAFALKTGEVSDVVESPFGFHIIKRESLVEVHLGHVLVQWEGVNRSAATRTQDEARAIIDEAKARLAAGEPLATVAAELSDGPSGVRGGDLGWFQKGQMTDDFDEVAFKLKRGEISPVVESAAGYHVIVRIR